MTASRAVKSHERGMDGTGCGADASSMFRFEKGDNPETSALRPSRCLRVGVAGNWRASRTPLAWRLAEVRNGLTIAQSNWKSSGLVK